MSAEEYDNVYDEEESVGKPIGSFSLNPFRVMDSGGLVTVLCVVGVGTRLSRSEVKRCLLNGRKRFIGHPNGGSAVRDISPIRADFVRGASPKD